MPDEQFKPSESEVQSGILEMGSVTVRGPKAAIHCLTIIGQIEGHQLLPQNAKTTKYEHVLPQLAAIEESPDIQGLLILLNTVGGDIEAGLAIAELIRGLSTPSVSLVLGGGHSIGVPMAVAARVSMIAPSAAMTIHPVRMNGTVLGVAQTFTYLRKVQERIVRFVAQNSKVREEDYLALMHRNDELAGDMGSVIHGAEAVELGLIDRLGTLSEALAELHRMIEAGSPA
ncbi:MAG: ATP-dependent Clp protease proteolytic subunit [Oscillospiraceae bacterium]|jgi:ATP-dependent protease ClpP protease subunit|nr:ATP-dependent Clp protease proteolytic subunit [Oscillospiraceae bacterium]